MTTFPTVTQALELASGRGSPFPRVTQVSQHIVYGPHATKEVGVTQMGTMSYGSGGNTNVTANVTQVATLTAYRESAPQVNRADAWTFVMDGHRFYVLPLGPEGDWAYDTTTHEWCQLQTQGFDGLNFAHGCMWGLRVVGGDTLYPYLYELDPTQPLDESFRQVEHIVTGGIAHRGRHSVGVANFTLTASVGDDAAITKPIMLAFSDDNGQTWSKDFDIPLTNVGSQQLIWNALGSYSAPGRIFRITDYAGPIRLDGADCVLTIGDGADSGQGDGGPN